MLSLKSISTAFVVSTFLVGCTTHSASLQNTDTTAHTTPTLQSHHWALQQALTPQGAIDTQWQVPVQSGQLARTIELDFLDNQRLSVNHLCNRMNGGYQTNNTNITITRLASTMMACSDKALMQLEKNVANQLPKARSWHIVDGTTPVLELSFDSGATWQLQGTPTHETLYGPSEQIFLEIAPKKVACNHPPVPNAQCLQVREIKYSEKGLKQATGAWSNYYGSIEGYQHQPGVRNILRLKRFTRNPVPADVSKYVDVLDLVVESEIIR